MITPTKPANRISKEFVVCDIENRSNGNVITIDTFDGVEHTLTYGWCEWLQLVSTKAKKDNRYRTIYAHNGGGWDWLSFIEWIIKGNHEQTFTTIENGNRIIAVTVPVSPKLTIRLTDSVYLLASSLDAAALKYTGKGKVKLEHLPEWYWDNDRETYWRYVYADTELLYETLSAFSSLIYTRIAPVNRLGLTLPSTAMRCFTTRFLKSDITIPTNEKVKRMLREAYTGGRVEVFRSGHYDSVSVYDFNSLYPSVMRNTPVPTTGNVVFTKDIPSLLNNPSVSRIRFLQRDQTKYPLLLKNGMGTYGGEGVYFGNELSRLLHNANGDITVIEGFYFPESAVVFEDYVNTLYTLRMEDKEGALGNACKLLLNSLYGKFGQQPERTRTMRIDAEQAYTLIQNGIKLETINEEYGIYRISESKSVNFEHVGIAGTITSEARSRLWESFDSGTVYCDTDSIHTTTKHNHHTSSNIGDLKLEFNGEAVYVGKKLYALRDSKKEKVRAKGIRVGGKLGFDLTFDGLKTLLNGSTIACTFQGATTANAVLKGKRSCIFSPRTRIIRKTASV